MGFEYFTDNTIMNYVEMVFYVSNFFFTLTYVFSVFNNLENIDWIRKKVLDERNHISIFKLGILRVVVILIILSPLFVLKDLFYLRIISGNVISTFVGFFLPVS